MVSNVTSLTGNGLKDWLIQRVTAILMGIFTIYLGIFILIHPNMDYTEWKTLFQCPAFEIATILTLFALTLHALVGIWTVTTDYIKPTYTRITLQMLIVAGLILQFVWGLMIVWGQ